MRTPDQAADASAEARWRRQLTEGSAVRWKRRLHARLPSAPRCKMCASPFGGIGGVVMPLLGHARWPKNPKYCAGCYAQLSAHHGGAEIDCSLLFADVRGSTALAERTSPREFTRLMGRFHDVAAEILVGAGAIVDKFVGDEIIGIFIPAMATDAHPRHAVQAARRLLASTGHASGARPWVPVGVGVNTGIAYVGSVGVGMDTEMTAMGDVVNTTARLSGQAGAGEILVPIDGAIRAGVAIDRLEHRRLDLKGKAEPVDVVVVRA